MTRSSLTSKQKEEPPLAKRVAWLKEKHAQQLAEYHFANGFRAGLECALLAIEDGRDILGHSIDAGEATIR